MGRQVTPKGYSSTVIETVEGASSAWDQVFAADLGGLGGAVADGGTLSIGGLTFTRRGAAVDMEQVAEGLRLTRVSTGKTVFGTPLTSLDASYDKGFRYIIAVRAKMTTWLVMNGNHLTAGVWRDDAGTPREMIHAGPFYVVVGPNGNAMVARRESVTGVYETEEFQATGRFTTMPAYLRWTADVTPGKGISSRFAQDASSVALPTEATLLTYGSDGQATISPRTNFAFDTIGIQAYFAAATDVTLERIEVYRSPGG